MLPNGIAGYLGPSDMSELVTAQGIAGDQGTPGTPGGIVSKTSLFELCPLNSDLLMSMYSCV